VYALPTAHKAIVIKAFITAQSLYDPHMREQILTPDWVPGVRFSVFRFGGGIGSFLPDETLWQLDEHYQFAKRQSAVELHYSCDELGCDIVCVAGEVHRIVWPRTCVYKGVELSDIEQRQLYSLLSPSRKKARPKRHRFFKEEGLTRVRYPELGFECYVHAGGRVDWITLTGAGPEHERRKALAKSPPHNVTRFPVCPVFRG
jgi:hypothetical protein